MKPDTMRNPAGIVILLMAVALVYPAAGFVAHVTSGGKTQTVELNMEPSEGATRFAEARYGPATELVPAYVDKILNGGWQAG